MAEEGKKLDCADCGDPGIDLGSASKLWVKDRFVDAAGMDGIMEEVFHMGIKDRNRIAEELMVRFLASNRIDEALHKDYRLALMDEYERRLLPYL
jgi:hypothetical protein